MDKKQYLWLRRQSRHMEGKTEVIKWSENGRGSLGTGERTACRHRQQNSGAGIRIWVSTASEVDRWDTRCSWHKWKVHAVNTEWLNEGQDDSMRKPDPPKPYPLMPSNYCNINISINLKCKGLNRWCHGGRAHQRHCHTPIQHPLRATHHPQWYNHCLSGWSAILGCCHLRGHGGNPAAFWGRSHRTVLARLENGEIARGMD